MSGVRADIRLVELGLAGSREKARSLIMAGEVYLDAARVDKPGASVPEDCTLIVKEQAVPFVSRGGLKLDKAVRKYCLSLQGKVAMDIGASTGGFTDCMLQNGAAKVYAIDVGYGQLDWKLRNDHRVVVMERTNARNMEPGWFAEQPEFASIDVSFISVKLILPGMYASLSNGAKAVVLVKPQFEAGRGKVGKNGVVRERETHRQVVEDTARFAEELGFVVEQVDYSPITGPKGNIEFLLVLSKGGEKNEKNIEDWVKQVVEEAHCELD
ncbi:MAG: TlyA family RNA methyltransferase [Clostridia bacterium]|nr:TlyA family RNA methyltransferase [Clostridia bacterium]